jgi:glyceraldehyde 3-phosphate dehydrogenase
LTIQTETPVTVAEVNSFPGNHALASPVLGWITQPLVSTDLRGRPESLILSAPETSVSADGLLRLFGWYDNEWGFPTDFWTWHS